MARETIWVECNDCHYREEGHNEIDGTRKMKQHANAKPGHQVSLYREYFPDGGRDYISRIMATGPVKKGDTK